MTEGFRVTRLCNPDPWDIVVEARRQRGSVVAGWIAAAFDLTCSIRFLAAAAGRRGASPGPEAIRTGRSPTPGSYGQADGQSTI